MAMNGHLRHRHGGKAKPTHENAIEAEPALALFLNYLLQEASAQQARAHQTSELLHKSALLTAGVE